MLRGRTALRNPKSSSSSSGTAGKKKPPPPTSPNPAAEIMAGSSSSPRKRFATATAGTAGAIPDVSIEQVAAKKIRKVAASSSQPSWQNTREQEEDSKTTSEYSDDDEYRHWLARVQTGGEWDLQFAPDYIGNNLRFAPDYIRNNISIVMAAIDRSYGTALQYASPELQNNRVVVSRAIKNSYGYDVLQHASPDLRKDKMVVLASVQKHGISLQHASPDLRDDKQVVITAVQESSNTLEYSSPRMKADKEVVIAAIRNDPHGWTLRYASPELQNDREVVMETIGKPNSGAIRYVSPALQRDKEIVLVAVQNDPFALHHTTSFQNDKDVVLTAMKQDPDVIRYVHQDLKHDKDVLIAAGMFDENHVAKKDVRTKVSRKIGLSTRFALDPTSQSEATWFTRLLKHHQYIQSDNFKLYAPNAFHKKTCDPEWTKFDWPCRGTKETCSFHDSLKTGHPTDDCCWRYSFRCQLQEAKDSGGFMLQLVESAADPTVKQPPKLGDGQRIEMDMAGQLQLKIFHVYRPNCADLLGRVEERSFTDRNIREVAKAIKDWYDGDRRDMTECVVRPSCPPSWS